MTALYLYDDARARQFEPFALTRPVAALRAGSRLIQERWSFALGLPVRGLLGPAHRASFAEAGTAPAAPERIPAGSIIANARFAPRLRRVEGDGAASAGTAGRGHAHDLWLADGRGDAVAARTPRDLPGEFFADGGLTVGEISRSASETALLDGWWLDAPWDLVRHLAAMLAADIDDDDRRAGYAPPPATSIVIGSHAVHVARGATVEPMVVFDATGGPIQIEPGATIQAMTRLVGPCFIGAHSTVLGDRVAVCAIGDHCKVRGEMSTTVMLGHANKGHDGFVGHSYLGRWTNLGAGTTTSNLKNTYGSVALWSPAGMMETGMTFLGTLVGDHAKTGIGTRLTTGTVIGAGANVFGSTMPPRVVAPFAWGDGTSDDAYRLDKFLEVAERVMARRQVTLDEPTRAVLRAAHARRWRPGAGA